MIKKKMLLALLFAMLSVSVPKIFADGGSWSVICKRTIACPAGQTGSIVQSISVNGNNVGCNGNNYWGNAKVISNTCVVTAPVVSFSYYGYNNSTQGCPASQPQGVVNIQQSYEVWSDGSTRNPSGWYETSRSCVAIKSRTQSDSRSYSCPSNQSGSITQTRTYDVWTDGTTKNYSAWNVSSNTCKSAPLTPNPAHRIELCKEGYTGKITYKWVVYNTNDSYSAYDSDGKLISYVLSTPHQQELVDVNSCSLVKSREIDSKAGTQIFSCDKYYNVPDGTYVGLVYKFGDYVSSYDSSELKTNTIFNITSVDVTQCVADPDKKYSTESITVACDSGMSGQITKTRTVATAPNGSKSYPNGTDYTVSSNTCAGTSPDSAPAEIATTTKTSLIENLSLTSTMLSDSAYSSKIVEMLKGQAISPGETHRLNLVVNDLSSGKYNATNVTNVVKAFKSAVGNGAEFKITLPRSIDKYAGNGGIQSGKGISLTGSQLNGSKLTVKYMDANDKKALSMSIEKSVEIQIFNGDLSGIDFAQD